MTGSMNITPFQALACPLDGDPLIQKGNCWGCPAGHSFDVARQGYVHLLPVQKKKTLDPGDSKVMVAARQRFLHTGFYQPIAEAVNRTVLADTPTRTPLSCLDAGAGEGYYLRQLAAEPGLTQPLELIGLDISKWAVLAAAKQDRRVSWVVGTNANLPIQTESLDRILCLFGFPVYGEFARVLRPGGQLIQADAGADHLRELREIIYPTLREPAPGDRELPPGFELAGTESLRYELTLPSQAHIADLLAMTPHLYRAKAEGLEKAQALDSLSVTVDVVLRRYVRTEPIEG